MGSTGNTRSNQTIEQYGLTHRPGNPLLYPDEVATADNLTGGEFFPSDFLTHPDYYLDVSDAGAKETIRILRQIQGNPDAEVTIYRGAPSGGTLNQGDWVTLSESYALQYAGDSTYSDNANSKVYSYTVRAGDLSFDGDDIHEFGYWGKKLNKGRRIS